MANFFFFTDIDLLQAQTQEQAFGPIDSTQTAAFESTKDKYRVTDKHTATSNPLAYAVCKGKVLVQPDANNALLVNVILKPEIQPQNHPSVKYYIYRGIIASSLITGTLVSKDTNTLTKSINDKHKDPSKKVLGIEMYNTEGYNDTDLVDNAFYLPRNTFELWPVDGGWSIGTFDKDNLGFEIMLDVLGFNPTFDLIRKNTNCIEVPSLTGSENPAQIFSHWNDKEAILNYLDPAAYYGNFYDDKIAVRKSTDTVSTTLIPEFEKVKNDDIYKNVLSGTTNSNFINRNKIYLDIRNELNYSFNYFGNYSKEIKISYNHDDVEPTVIKDYYGNGWPIMVLTDLPNGNNKSLIKFSMPLGDNTLPLAYVSIGSKKSTIIERVKKGKTRFVDLTVNDTETYTSNSISINTPNCNDTNNSRISSYIRIKYLKRFDGDAPTPISEGNVIRTSYYLDNIFVPLEMKLPSEQSNNLQINIYDNDTYINDSQNDKIDFVSKIGIAKNSENIFLFALLKDNRNNSSSFVKNKSFALSSGIYETQEDFLSFINSTDLNYELVTDNDINITIYRYTEFNESSFFSSLNTIDFNNNFYALVLSNDEFQAIINTINTEFTTKYKVYLAYKDTYDLKINKSIVTLRGLSVDNDSIVIKEVPVLIDGQNIYVYQGEYNF